MLGRHFKIKTGHFSLKHLMEQRITNHFLLKWLPKGYDYEILYKKEGENVVANSLSKVTATAKLFVTSISSISSCLLRQVKNSLIQDIKVQ